MWKTTLSSLIRIWHLALLVGLAAGLVACIYAADSNSAPTIALQPTGGIPGTTVFVAGSSFPAGTAVAIRLGPPDVGATPLAYATATADAAGTFTATFSMPAQWPDGNPIDEGQLLVIALNEDGGIKATSPFDFRPGAAPTLLIDPDEGEPGQRVRVRGADFPPGQPLALRLVTPAGVEVERSREVAAVLSDGVGSFLTTVTIPGEWSAGGPVREQSLIFEVLTENGQSLVRADFFNRAGEDAGPFFHAPAPPLCAEMQSELSILLAAPVVRSEGDVAFQDPRTGLTGESCRLAGETIGNRFSGQDEATMALRALFQERDWQEEKHYAQVEPGLVGFGMEEGDLLALVQLELRPMTDSDCVDGQSMADCALDLPRSQVRYTIVIDLVEGNNN